MNCLVGICIAACLSKCTITARTTNNKRPKNCFAKRKENLNNFNNKI